MDGGESEAVPRGAPPRADPEGRADEDAALLAALRLGERAAFDALYDAWRPRVFAFLARLSGDRLLAEDLMQETFLKLARHGRDLPPGTHLRRWLFTVARNLFIDQRRRALLDVDRLRELRLWPSRPRRGEETPFDLAEAGETRRRLEGALLGLPVKHREAVLLVCVEGFSPAEAAEALGVKPAALRQRLARGRKMLREALEAR